MDGQKYQVQVEVPLDAPDGYKEHALQAARRKLGNELFDVLWKSKLPAVVDVEEKIIPHSGDYFCPTEAIRLIATVTEVSHRHVILTHAPALDFGYLGTPSKSPVKRLLGRVSNFFARFATS